MVSPGQRAHTDGSPQGQALGRPRSRRVASLAVFLAFAGTSLSPAAVVQHGNLRLTLLSQVMPHKLPRTGTAPIAVFVAGHVQAVHGGVPDQLKRLTIKVNRRALLQSRGLPVCRIPEVQPATTSRALATCGHAIVGSGQFWASIVLPEQGAYRTQGRLLVFNGRTTTCRASRSTVVTRRQKPGHARTRREAVWASSHFLTLLRSSRSRSRNSGEHALIQSQPLLDSQSQSDSSWGSRSGPGATAQGESSSRLAIGPGLRWRERPPFASALTGRLWPSRSRTQGARRSERTSPYVSRARDRGRRDAKCHSRPVLLAHIFTSNPFATSFVITFHIKRIDDGYYGTQLTASLPQALGDWGYVDRIKLTLKREYRWRGRRLSYFNAGCPALPGAGSAVFHLARAAFTFAHTQVGLSVNKTCAVKQ